MFRLRILFPALGFSYRLNKTGMFVLNKTVIFLDHHKANHDRY